MMPHKNLLFCESPFQLYIALKLVRQLENVVIYYRYYKVEDSIRKSYDINEIKGIDVKGTFSLLKDL